VNAYISQQTLLHAAGYFENSMLKKIFGHKMDEQPDCSGHSDTEMFDYTVQLASGWQAKHLEL
jgi:hypothetical protein